METLNFPAAYGGPTVGQAYRKRKVHRLYGDPQNHINVLLQKLGDVDRSNPGILRLTMGTLGVPESRFLVRPPAPRRSHSRSGRVLASSCCAHSRPRQRMPRIMM